MTDPIEAMARGLHAIEESWNDYEWEYLPPTVRKLFMEQATAALAALSETHLIETQAERQAAIDAAEARGHARGVAEERERAAGILETIRPRPIAYDAVARIIREQDQ